MKKLVSLFIALALLLTTIPLETNAQIYAATESTEKNTAKISVTKKSMYVGTSYKLKVSGTTEHIMWKSSNKKVATVDKNGLVTAKAKGKATITATIGAGSNNIKLTCVITVKNRLSTNLKGKPLDCPMDEYQEVLVTLANPKEGESVCAMYDPAYVEIEYGETEKNVTPLYITPIKKGKIDIEIYVTDSFRIYAPITITLNIGSEDSDWIGKEDLKEIYNVTSIIDKTSVMLLYDSSALTGRTKSFYIVFENNIEIDKEYTFEGLRYKYLDKDTIVFNLDDLAELEIIDR